MGMNGVILRGVCFCGVFFRSLKRAQAAKSALFGNFRRSLSGPAGSGSENQRLLGWNREVRGAKGGIMEQECVDGGDMMCVY